LAIIELTFAVPWGMLRVGAASLRQRRERSVKRWQWWQKPITKLQDYNTYTL